MRVIICGDRDWTNVAKVVSRIQQFPKDTIIVEGGCRGADTIARLVAAELGYRYEEHPANWKEHHRAAGPIRNRFMITESRRRAEQDGHELKLVVAFHSHIEDSKGTKDMLAAAEKAGIETETVK